MDGASAEVAPTGRGVSGAGQAKRDALQQQRDELDDVLEALGGEASVRAVGARLRQTDLFDRLGREGLSRQRPLDAFVAPFPAVFQLYGSGAARGLRLLAVFLLRSVKDQVEA